MDIMTPMPEILEKENSMRQALITPATQNFDASKVAKKNLETIREERIETVAEPQTPTMVKKKKPRGMSAMSPEKKAAHMEKMRIASANARKKRAEAKKNPPKQNDTPVPSLADPEPVQTSSPIPTPMGSSTSTVPTPHRAVAVAEQPTIATPSPYREQPPPQPRAVRPPVLQQEIDYNKLAETMERRKAEGNRRVVTKEEINFFEQTVRASERKKTLADLEKEQEKAIKDFMSKRTKSRTMPKAEKSYAIWDNW